MKRKPISADQLITELNRAYEQDKDHDPHNRFQHFPEGATGKAIRGYSTAGLWTPAHTRALNAVFAEFELGEGE